MHGPIFHCSFVPNTFFMLMDLRCCPCLGREPGWLSSRLISWDWLLPHWHIPEAAATQRRGAAFLVSVLGLMLFSYYQGRSHRAVLILAWWPIFPLMTLLLDSLFEQRPALKWRMLPAGLIGCLPAAILLGSTASFFENLTMVGDYAGRQLGCAVYSEPDSFDNDAAVIGAFSGAGKPIWIISPREADLHLATRHTELAPCSFNELLLMADYPRLAYKLESQPEACIWIDRVFFEAALPQHQGVRSSPIC